MKRYKITNIRISGFRLLMVLSAILLMINACKKNNTESSSAAPEINRIRLLDPAKKDSSFLTALPGTEVVIEGVNIGDAVKIYFNNTEAYFNSVYNTDNIMIVVIPKSAPTAANNPDVPSQIKLVTTHGETTFDFALTPPKPSITYIKNENTIPGQEMTIVGENFFQITNVTFHGARVVTDFTVDAAGTQILVNVPADLGIESGKLLINAKFGEVNSAGPINKVSGEGMISNFSQTFQVSWGIFNWAYWGAVLADDPAAFPNNREHYLQNLFGGIDANNAVWYEDNRSGNFTNYKVFNTITASDSASHYALKFEVNTIEPWKTGICQLRFNDTYVNRWTPYLTDLTAVDMTYNTGHLWQTVTIPLSEFKTNEGNGTAATTLGNFVAADGTLLFGYRFITEADPIALFNAAFDNFRIVKIK